MYVKSGGTWSQQAYLKASNADAEDQFGLWLSLSDDGNTLAVGAHREASLSGNELDNTAPLTGALYVFARSGTAWTQQAYLKASNAEAGDIFGVPMSLTSDGNALVVGANGEASAATGIDKNQASNAAISAGAAYVFVRSGTTWSQQAYIKASNTNAGDNFGAAIAISGDGSTLAIGAPHEASDAIGINGDETNNSAMFAGAVYVFTRAGSVWSQQAYVKASQSGDEKWFGSAVALSDDGATLAIGAVAESSAATGVNGNQADSSAPSSGAAYVFTRAGAAWSQQAYLKASNTNVDDRFGFGLAISSDGATLAVGARDEDSAAIGLGGDQNDRSAASSGAVYVFQRAGTTWSQRAYVKASNTGAGDQFGFGVALSSDGKLLAATAIRESSAATGISGDGSNNAALSAGAAYVVSDL